MSVVVKEGALRKKGSHMSIWGTRYFVLRGSTLLYYSHNTDTESKGRYYLKKNCRITPIHEEDYKRKKQYVFSIVFPLDPTSSSGNDKWREKVAESNTSKKKGLLMGDKAGERDREVAKGGSAKESRDREVILASDTAYDAQGWVLALEKQIAVAASDATSGTGKKQSGALAGKMSNNEINTALSGGGSRTARVPHSVRVKTVHDWVRRVEWTLEESEGGLRFYSPQRGAGKSEEGGQNVLAQGPCARVNLTVSGSSTEVLKTVLHLPSMCMNGAIRGMRLVERLDTYVDIVHLTLREMFIEPTLTSSRDFCLMRYWKQMGDGSYVVCLDSTFHQDCPVVTGCVRGDMHAAYVISPPRTEGGSVGEGVAGGGDNETDFGSTANELTEECLLTFVCQMHPKGWMWRRYYKPFLHNFLGHVLDIRDVIDMNKFSRFRFDPYEDDELEVGLGAMQRRMSVGGRAGEAGEGVKASGSGVEEVKGGEDVIVTVANTPVPLCPPAMYAEPAGDTFMLRGPTYLKNKKKQASDPCLFKFLCIDMYHVPEATHNLCSHPNNRVYKALQRGDDTWIFCLNIMVPSSPPFSFVAYWEGDRRLIEADTPFGKVARPFFNGNDDEFRNSRFKLIPKVVEGNYFIRMAVKDTPTLLGNKLKQYYYRGDNYFEVDVDVGSSAIANQTVGLCIGVSTAIVVDMGICFQGNEEDELPEVMLCACTCNKIDTTYARPL